MNTLTLTPQLRIVNPHSLKTSDSYTLSVQTNVPVPAVAVGLGNDALISAKSYYRAESQQKKEFKFALLEFARTLLQNHNVTSNRTEKPHRTRFCLATRIDSTIDVGITLNGNPEQSRAGLTNLQTCRSICACPVCAERLMLEHAQTVKKALIWAENEGKIPVLVSLTASHHDGMKLEDFKTQFKKAWRMFSNHRTWRDYKKKFGIEHWIAAREATREALVDNGWHYHMHILLFVDKGSLFNAELPGDMSEKFTTFWLSCLAAAELTGTKEHACDVRSGTHVGAEYLTKLGINETVKGELEFELTGAKYKGNTIWDVLNDAMFGDIRAGYLYIEYVKVMQGENWITTSHGLHDLLEDIELPVPGETDGDKLVLWMNIDPEMWRIVVKNRAIHMVLLYAARYRDEQKILDYIEALRE